MIIFFIVYIVWYDNNDCKSNMVLLDMYVKYRVMYGFVYCFFYLSYLYRNGLYYIGNVYRKIVKKYYVQFFIKFILWYYIVDYESVNGLSISYVKYNDMFGFM